jgi:hypothetical protein
MAAKQTAQLIPLCHPLPLQKVEVQLTPDPKLPGYQIRAEVRTKAETGVEMEALTAASVAALTLYDMAKALEKSIQIESIHLVSKTGGKSEITICQNNNLILSDKLFAINTVISSSGQVLATTLKFSFSRYLIPGTLR